MPYRKWSFAMKYIHAIALIMALVTILSSCGSDGGMETPEVFEKVLTQYVDLSNYEKTDMGDSSDILVLYSANEPYPLGEQEFQLSFDCGGDLEIGLWDHYLEGRGWKEQGDGKFYNEKGQIVELELTTSKGNKTIVSEIYVANTVTQTDTKTGKMFEEAYSYAPSFVLSGKITNDSTLEQVLETFGPPFIIYYAVSPEIDYGSVEMHFLYGYVSTLVVRVDVMTNKIQDIRISPLLG